MGQNKESKKVDLSDGNNLKELAAQKEQEWKDLQELRIQSLQESIKSKDKQLSDDKAKFLKLKEDFKYNMKLLQERDAELDQFDSTFAKLKANLTTKDSEISSLKIFIDQLKADVERERRSREEIQIYYQQNLRKKQADLEQYRNQKDAEVNKERENLESVKRKVEHQLKEMENELDIQRQELTTGFDEAMKRREHEYRIAADEMSTNVLSHEMKVKLLNKEIEMLKASNERTNQQHHEMEGSHQDLEKQLRDKEWQLQDVTAIKDAKISELEDKLCHNETSMVKIQEQFKRKHAEMDRYAREKETALTKVKEGHHERERHLADNIRDLTSQLEKAEIEFRRQEWSSQDTIKEKDLKISKLSEEIKELKDSWDVQMSRVSKTAVARDLEMESLRANDQKLKAELIQNKETLERYKKELSAAVEREAGLERSKAQLELDWQHRYEDVEREQFERSEDLIKKLTQARNEALASVKEKSKELTQRDDLIKILKGNHDQAMATLKQNGLSINRNVQVTQLSAEEMENLEQQNQNLRKVIKEMRLEMEELGQRIPKSPVVSDKRPATEDYVKSLEQEIKELKNKNRQIDNASKDHVKSAQAEEALIRKEVSNDSLVRAHVESLNNTIGDLRSEKMELSAQLRKQQVRLQHMESMVDELSKQPRQKQVELEQLQYELNAQTRRHKTETASLQQQLRDAQLQVMEARREADEYYKSSLQRNMENRSLASQISSLKMDFSKKNPSVNFGAQELLIQQLQDEIHRLHQYKKGEGDSYDHNLVAPRDDTRSGPINEQLQRKLKMAAKHIKQLAVEKQQLIEIGNRLRAELMKNGIQPPNTAKSSNIRQAQSHDMPESSQPQQSNLGHMDVMAQRVQSKLQHLQKLQYQLTRKELGKKSTTIPPPQVTVKYSSESNEDKKVSGHSDLVPSHDIHATMTSSGGSSTQRASSPSHQGEQPLHISLSSVGGESLQEIWKMLDDPSFISANPGLTARNNASKENDDWTVKGQKSQMISKPQRSSPTSQSKPAEKRVPSQKSKHLKIRNYNARDDAL